MRDIGRVGRRVGTCFSEIVFECTVPNLPEFTSVSSGGRQARGAGFVQYDALAAEQIRHCPEGDRGDLLLAVAGRRLPHRRWFATLVSSDHGYIPRASRPDRQKRMRRRDRR